MKGIAAAFVLGLIVVNAMSCGKMGPLQAPLAREPQPAENFSCYQRGNSIIVEWTNPSRYLDGHPLKALGAVELWAFEAAAKSRPPAGRSGTGESGGRLLRRFDKGAFADLAKRETAGGGRWSFVLPPEAVSDHKPVTLELRIKDEKGRTSKFTAPVTVARQVCPGPPRESAARVERDRIVVTWRAPESNIDGTRPAAVAGYVVYRSDAGGPFKKLSSSPIPGSIFEDRDFRFGRTYAYVVRALAANTNPQVESDDSVPATAVPLDVFPPEPPADLAAIAGPGGVSLSWRSGGGSPAGYKVWRREASETAFTLLSPRLVTDMTFTDTAAEKGKTYVYAVSACGEAGKESPKVLSGPLTIKGSRP